jgi:hypothetical protein
VPLPIRQATVELPPPAELGTLAAEHNGVLVLDGDGDCLRVSSAQLPLPDGPLTLEAWCLARSFAGRRGLVTKTQSSEFGLFCNDGTIDFSVHLGGRYVSAKTELPVLLTDRWHHIAGVYDGAEVRVYVDGALVATANGKGSRRGNELPLFIGADPDGNGRPMSFFDGRVDDVRLSQVARYRGETFEPPATHRPDADTVLLVACDRDFGPWAVDASVRRAHPVRVGDAHCTVEKRPQVR